MARRETYWLARRQNVEGPAAARARSRAACRGGERARRSESTYAQLVDMMSRIVAHNRLHDGSLRWLARKRVLRAGNRPNKTQRVEGNALVPDFLRSLGSATSNVANKSVMRVAEWTIAARRAMLHSAQMKYRYFVPECCKQNAIFSGTSHQNR